MPTLQMMDGDLCGVGLELLPYFAPRGTNTATHGKVVKHAADRYNCEESETNRKIIVNEGRLRKKKKIEA